MPDFVNMKIPEYEYLSEQGFVENLGEIFDNIEKPTEQRVLEIYEETEKKEKHSDHMFYAALYKAIQKQFPYFSSRDIRNIQSAISLRLTDFDLEDDWFENPEIYFQKPYETKYGMLQELMRENMKGLNFSDIRKQEVIRYLDNMATIAETDFKRKVEKQIGEMNVSLEARRLFEKN